MPGSTAERRESKVARVQPALLKEQIEEAIGQLERALAAGTPLERIDPRCTVGRRVLPVGPVEIGRELRFLRQLRSALAGPDPAPVWFGRAGLGSDVYVRESLSRGERIYRLMLGPLDPLDAGQVTLDSPVGQALLGRRRGEEVWLESPCQRRRLRILTLKTLPERLGIAAPSGRPVKSA